MRTAHGAELRRTSAATNPRNDKNSVKGIRMVTLLRQILANHIAVWHVRTFSHSRRSHIPTARARAHRRECPCMSCPGGGRTHSEGVPWKHLINVPDSIFGAVSGLEKIGRDFYPMPHLFGPIADAGARGIGRLDRAPPLRILRAIHPDEPMSDEGCSIYGAAVTTWAPGSPLRN